MFSRVCEVGPEFDGRAPTVENHRRSQREMLLAACRENPGAIGALALLVPARNPRARLRIKAKMVRVPYPSPCAPANGTEPPVASHGVDPICDVALSATVDRPGTHTQLNPADRVP